MPDFPEPHENLPTPKPDTQVAGNNRTALDDLQPCHMRELLPDDALISIERSLTWQGAYYHPRQLAAATCGPLNHPGAAVALVGIPVMAVARAFIAPQKAPGG